MTYFYLQSVEKINLYVICKSHTSFNKFTTGNSTQCKFVYIITNLCVWQVKSLIIVMFPDKRIPGTETEVVRQHETKESEIILFTIRKKKNVGE